MTPSLSKDTCVTVDGLHKDKKLEQGYLCDSGWSTCVVAVVVFRADAVHGQNSANGWKQSGPRILRLENKLKWKSLRFFLVKQVPGRGTEQRESGKTVLYPLIIIITLISYIIVKLLIKRRTIPAKTGNGTLKV